MEPLHLETLIAAVAFVGVRVSGILLFPPFLGSSAIAPSIKVGLALSLTALLFPVSGMVGLELDALGWVRALSGELVVGLLLGLTLQFVFEAAQFAGQVIGLQAGFSLINILDPQTEVDTPVLSILNQMVTLMIFLELNIHHWLLRGIAASFAYLPPGKVFASGAATGGLMRSASGIWLSGIQIAAPVLVATVICDLALGFVAKASPQLPVMLVGLSLKTILGLAILAGSIALWPRIFEHHFTEAVALGERLLHLAR